MKYKLVYSGNGTCDKCVFETKGSPFCGKPKHLKGCDIDTIYVPVEAFPEEIEDYLQEVIHTYRESMDWYTLFAANGTMYIEGMMHLSCALGFLISKDETDRIKKSKESYEEYKESDLYKKIQEYKK